MTLAEQGLKRIQWASREMPVLQQIKKHFERNRPLKDKRVVACMHITTETANLIDTIRAGGAEVVLCASNPLSTQDDVVAAINIYFDNCSTRSYHGESTDQYYDNIASALNLEPHFVLDDGCDLVNYIYTKRKDLLSKIIGGTEETTTGVQRLKAMEKNGLLQYPIICINDAQTKHMFDNQYGTGQSTLDGIIRATNTLLAGKTFVVAGYGWCGKGLAQKAKGMGCKVIVTEINPIKALQAYMDGFEVMPMLEACKRADYIVTVTGNKHVINVSHFAEMKDGVILANAGHFDVEIDLQTLKEISYPLTILKNNLEEYILRNQSHNDSKRIYVLGQGRLVNLACADGHPACVMDMSFANQALSLQYFMSENVLENKLYPVPYAIDYQVAELKIESLNISLDKLSSSQIDYLCSWQEGT